MRSSFSRRRAQQATIPERRASIRAGSAPVLRAAANAPPGAVSAPLAGNACAGPRAAIGLARVRARITSPSVARTVSALRMGVRNTSAHPAPPAPPAPGEPGSRRQRTAADAAAGVCGGLGVELPTRVQALIPDEPGKGGHGALRSPASRRRGGVMRPGTS